MSSNYIRMRFDGSGAKKIAFGCLNNQGARNYQEDSFGFSSVNPKDVKKQGFTAIIADGMGGLSGGAQISQYFVMSMLEMQKNRDPDIPVNIYLSRAVRAVNSGVLSSGMRGGTTAAVVMCLPVGIYWCTVGDSRIYLAREGGLTALNEDSDYLNRLFEKVISGEMTYEEASGDSKKDALNQYIGYKGGIYPDVNSKPLIPRNKDKILICTDGVYNALSNEELLSALKSPASEAAGLIESKVLSKGYSDQDNFTAIILEFLG